MAILLLSIALVIAIASCIKTYHELGMLKIRLKYATKEYEKLMRHYDDLIFEARGLHNISVDEASRLLIQIHDTLKVSHNIKNLKPFMKRIDAIKDKAVKNIPGKERYGK